MAHVLNHPLSKFEEELQRFCTEVGEPSYRCPQISEFLFQQRIWDPLNMRTLPGTLRDRLAANLFPTILDSEAVEHFQDGCRKFTFRLADHSAVEAIWVPAAKEGTLYLTTQVGVSSDYSFCPSDPPGVWRDLKPAEMLMQWLHVSDAVRGWSPGEVTGVVFSGPGDPLLNYDGVRTTLELLTSPRGFAVNPGSVSIATVGVTARFEPLLRDHAEIQLRLALHSALDATRARILPLSRLHSVAEIARCLKELPDCRNRVTVEVLHLKGINDSDDEVQALAAFLRETSAPLQLLPANPGPGRPIPTSHREELEALRTRLLGHGPASVEIGESRALEFAGAPVVASGLPGGRN